MKAGFVAIIGRPNAGKSTLLNKVMGVALAEVSSKAQMTRNRIQGIFNSEAGQIVFIDTPGVHRARTGGLNELLVKEAEQAIEDCQCIWYLVDPASAMEHEEIVISLVSRIPRATPLFIIQTKNDLNPNSELGKQIKQKLCENGGREETNTRLFSISARTKSGLNSLLEYTWEALPEHPRYFEEEDLISDRPSKFFVAEKIRRQLYRLLGDELPYSSAVKIERYDEKATPVRIEAQIVVERLSQVGMVVGNKGAKIKEIGTEARKDIEKFLGHPIFLGLRVSCIPQWTKNPRALAEMGFSISKERAKS